LNCPIPEINSTLKEGLDSEKFNLAYNLVAANVPGLTNLHSQNALEFSIVDDPVINAFENDSLNYQAGSNEVIVITVSMIQ